MGSKRQPAYRFSCSHINHVLCSYLDNNSIQKLFDALGRTIESVSFHGMPSLDEISSRYHGAIERATINKRDSSEEIDRLVRCQEVDLRSDCRKQYERLRDKSIWVSSIHTIKPIRPKEIKALDISCSIYGECHCQERLANAEETGTMYDVKIRCIMEANRRWILPNCRYVRVTAHHLTSAFQLVGSIKHLHFHIWHPFVIEEHTFSEVESLTVSGSTCRLAKKLKLHSLEMRAPFVFDVDDLDVNEVIYGNGTQQYYEQYSSCKPVRSIVRSITCIDATPSDQWDDVEELRIGVTTDIIETGILSRLPRLRRLRCCVDQYPDLSALRLLEELTLYVDDYTSITNLPAVEHLILHLTPLEWIDVTFTFTIIPEKVTLKLSTREETREETTYQMAPQWGAIRHLIFVYRGALDALDTVTVDLNKCNCLTFTVDPDSLGRVRLINIPKVTEVIWGTTK